MISPYSKCTEFYRHHKITVTSVPVGSDPSSGVVITTNVYNPSISVVDPLTSSSTPYEPFDNMDDFNDAIRGEIESKYPDIDIRVGEIPDVVGPQPGSGVDIPDPIQQDIYDNSILDNNLPIGTAPSGSTSGKGGVLVGPNVTRNTDPNGVYGKDTSGTPGYPQVTHPTTQGGQYSTAPFGAASYSRPGEIKAWRPKDTNNMKKHRKGLGRNETVADVVDFMARALDKIDSKRIRYVDPQSGSWANESRNNTLERLIGLQVSQIPLHELNESEKEVTFSRYVYEVVRSKSSAAIVEGKGIAGKELALKYGEDLASYIDVLDGDNIASIRAAAMAKRNSGVEFVPHTTEQNIEVSEVLMESIAGGKKKERSKKPSAYPDAQYNQINFRGNKIPPEIFNEVYKPKLGISYVTPVSWLDHIGNRRSRKRDNDSAKSILTLTTSASKMALSDIYFSLVNNTNYDIVDSQMRQQDRTETYYARQHAGGSYFDLLVNAKGLESDPNTITLRRVAASFSASFLCIKGQCSECKHYKGPKSGTSRTSAADGSATLNASLTCAYGYTDTGGKAKGPESFCGFDEKSPANPALDGIKYELNEKTSNQIRDARNAIEKDGSSAYLALMKQYQSQEMKVTPSDAASAAGNTASETSSPVLPPYESDIPSA
jgi:hypothetical protein